MCITQHDPQYRRVICSPGWRFVEAEWVVTRLFLLAAAPTSKTPASWWSRPRWSHLQQPGLCLFSILVCGFYCLLFVYLGTRVKLSQHLSNTIYNTDWTQNCCCWFLLTSVGVCLQLVCVCAVESHDSVSAWILPAECDRIKQAHVNAWPDNLQMPPASSVHFNFNQSGCFFLFSLENVKYPVFFIHNFIFKKWF